MPRNTQTPDDIELRVFHVPEGQHVPIQWPQTVRVPGAIGEEWEVTRAEATTAHPVLRETCVMVSFETPQGPHDLFGFRFPFGSTAVQGAMPQTVKLPAHARISTALQTGGQTDMLGLTVHLTLTPSIPA